MPFKIRTKLILSFFTIIFPIIIVFGIITLYNVNNIRKATLRSETISGEMQTVMSLQIALDKALMPANDYIVTGNKKYIDDFKTAAKVVEDLIKTNETLLVLKGMQTPEGKEEAEILNAVETAWQNIKRLSQKIFEIRNPVGNKEAATLMEEMDYKWAYPAISRLDKDREIDKKDYHEALDDVNRSWRLAWIIMLASGLVLATAGVSFAVYYSKSFVRPINTLHTGADKIATGDFKSRVDVKTGDEFEQLATGMNDMAEKLDTFYDTLKESKERYKHLIESVMDYIVTVSVEDGRPAGITHGPGSVAITGCTPEEHKADPLLWLRMVHEEDRYAVMGHAEAVLSGKTFPLEHRIVRKDGSIRWVRNTPVPQYNKAGQMVSYDALISDITVRKLAEISLEKAAKEWEATFDAITDPLFIHDKEFRVVRANLAYKNASGITFQEFIGRPYYEVFPKMKGPFKICLKATEVQEDEEMVEVEVSLSHTNRIFKVRAYPTIDIEGKYLYSIHILEDITETTLAQDRIKKEMEVTAQLLTIAEAVANQTYIDKLMERVNACIPKMLGCDICLIYAWEPETKDFRPVHGMGLPMENTPQFIAEHLDDRIAFIKKILGGQERIVVALSVEDLMWGRLSDGDMRPNKFALHPWLPIGDTIVGILLAKNKNPFGLIIAVFKQEKNFTEWDRQIMDGISNLVSTALEQARLYQEFSDKSLELSHKIEMIKVMNEVDRSILSTLESDELLKTVTRIIGRVVLSDMASVAMADMERGGIVHRASFGTNTIPNGAYVPFTDTSASAVFETGRPACVNNLSEIKTLLPMEKKFLDEGFLSLVSVPIVTKGEVVGALTVGAKRVASFTKEDLSALGYLGTQIGVALENSRLVSDLKELFISVVKSLSSAIDAKSPWTAGHSERVTKYALRIGNELGLSQKELKDIELAGLLHDIGKIGTYEAILDKPGKLTDEEFAIVKKHPAKGAELLEHIKQLKGVIPGVRNHHEFYNGTGYPDGLKGEAIPLMARILTVADSYDAMKADRPYRSGLTEELVLQEFRKCSGTQFDPKVVEAFLKGSRLPP